MIKPANPLGDYHDPATPHEFDRVIHVLVVDDHEMVRKMLHTMLDSYEDIQVIGEASDGEEAISLTRRLHPDAILMDVNMPKVNGIEATRRIKRNFRMLR